MGLGKILKLIRTNKSMTQKQMADHIGISQNYLSLIESNSKVPSADRLSSFAKTLKVSKDALVFVASQPPEELSLEDKKKYRELQSNIMSLLLLDITGEMIPNA